MGVPYLEIALYRWLFAGLFAALALAYWYAYRDPVGNRVVLYVAIVDLLGEIISIVMYLVSTSLRVPILWIGVVVLTGFAAVLIYYARALAQAGVD